MSPTTSIYDHLTINVHPPPKPHFEHLPILTNRQSMPFDERNQFPRRCTVTNISIPETIIHCSVNNQAYDRPLIRKSLTTQNLSTYNPRYSQPYQMSASSSNMETKSMDFRPLIISGCRRLGAIPSSSSMIIVKKKPSMPLTNMSFNQKPLTRSIPVDIIDSNIGMIISPTIPSSLSYSSSYSSSSSTSATSTNIGTVFLPIQDDYVDKSARIPSSASFSGDGLNYKSTIVMDSNVLRLIRRYDPVSSNTAGNKSRRSLEHTRDVWHTIASNIPVPQPSDSSPFLSHRSLTTTFEEDIPIKQSSAPPARLQRQQAIHEPEPSSSTRKTIRPILKYNSTRSRSEFIVQPHQREPLTVDIDSSISPTGTNESAATYQPLITAGGKRVCSALSKSEWDLRLQQEQTSIQASSPLPIIPNQEQEKESYRPSLGRSKSSTAINHPNDQDDDMDDYDEVSAPIITNGSCVEKLKKLFVTKPVQDLINPSIDSKPTDEPDLTQAFNSTNKSTLSSSLIKTSPNDFEQRSIHKPTTIVQEVTPTSSVFNKKPILKSQKTIDSPESVSRPNNINPMPSSELSYDAYRFRRSNDPDPIITRPRNIAKVEPYSINTNTVRPLYQSSQPSTTTVVPSKASTDLNSMGNTPTHSSTSSSAGSLGGIIHQPNIRHSDFLTPNPHYPTLSSQIPVSSSPLHPTPLIPSSESLSHGSLHQLPSSHIPSYNHRPTGLASSNSNSQQKYPSSTLKDFHSSMHTSSPALTNNNHYNPPTSYYYRPSMPTAVNNNRQQPLPEIPMHSTMIEQVPQQQPQSRRRFQKRKQMKRSKSVDLYQDPLSSVTTSDLNQFYLQPRSTSRECIPGGKDNLSSSSSSSSLTVDIERVNQAALLRYKSLDSMTFKNQKDNSNGKSSNHRRAVSKPIEFDFDSDDSVCGIPKARKLCTSSKNTAKSDGTLLGSSLSERDQHGNARAIQINNIGTSGPSTGITNSVRKKEKTDDQLPPMVESSPSTTKAIGKTTDGQNKMQSGIAFVEPQFYARSSDTSYSKRYDLNDGKNKEVYSTPSPPMDETFHDAIEDFPVKKKQHLLIREPVHVDSSTIIRPLSSTVIINPFERLRPLDSQNEPRLPDRSSLDQLEETNDSSTSTTTSRSVHLPVEKQRGLSEIIRKRNSRCKVEDYKRSIQKPNAADDQSQVDSTLPTSRRDQESTILSTAVKPDIGTEHLNKVSSFETPIDIGNNTGPRAQLSIERLNLLLTKDEQSKETDENLSVTDKRNLFEIITKDTQIGSNLPRSRSFKNEDSSFISVVTKKQPDGNGLSQTGAKTDASEKKPENENFDDDISKLSFKDKMTLFNKKKNLGLTPTSSLKNRSRLTQPITAEEVQAAANLTPSSSTKQLATTVADDVNTFNPEESENTIPVTQRLGQTKAFGDVEWKKRIMSPTHNTFGKVSALEDEPKPASTSKRQAPTLKYSAKKTNTDQEQRAKTVDIVRLRADSAIKTKDVNQTTSSTNGTTVPKSNNNVISVVKSDTISVLKPDDHLEHFFADPTKTLDDQPSAQLNIDDLNRIAKSTVRLQAQAPRVRPPRRQQQGAKNPLRQIQATVPTVDEYTEIHTNISEQEVRRIKRAQIAEHAGVAQEALAALTTTENFAEINLRKIDQTPVAKFGFEPYKEIMLILIKGGRQCSLRLVDPTSTSVNEGDCYLLITPLKVFAWLGRYANASEKSRTIDLIDYLKQHRDFGLRNEAKYFILDQARDDTESDSHAEFCDILQGEIDDYRAMDDVADDEFYETNIIELNRVYRVENDLLMPLDNFCFRPLSFQILDPNEVFVFDFGSELYVWNGKYADKTKRTMGLQLGQQLWNDTYDHSECMIDPFDPLDDKNEPTNPTGPERPEWCIFGKQNQNVETLLFKGKFTDWPTDLQELKPGTDATNKSPSTQRPPSIVEMLKPADVHKMLAKEDNPVNTIVDQVNLGRGRHWYDSKEMHGYDIQTISLNVWHVHENERHELPKSSYGQFYSDDAYIIRWRYKLNPMANNKSTDRKVDVSRDRVSYWIWQGSHANPNEKGILVLMSMFLIEEKGPHMYVIQEHEEAIFLQLFNGTLTIHLGQHNQSKEETQQWHLYIFLGEIDVETHWWEINRHSANLRSRTSFLLTNNIENLMLLWHGCGTTDEQQMLANRSAMKLRERCPKEFYFEGESDDIEFFEMQEGDEIELFWEGVNERNHERKYHSLLNVRSNSELSSTMRAFHLSSLHGPFIAQELLYPLRSPDHVSPFPLAQSDIYELHQPALCLVDTDTEVYIWQGWNDQSDDELSLQLSNANLVAQGPRDIRFTTERRCAFQTAIDYYKTKTSSSAVHLPCSIVYAGLEPIDFTNLFPKWTVNTKARHQNQLAGKKLNQKDSVIDVLNHLCRDQYTIEELRARPLPEGVDPSKIESYLSVADFQKEFRMSKDEFYALPYWKQTNIKKPLGFF